MARSDRDIFNDHVEALARRLGVPVNRLPDAERRRLLDDVRGRKLNDHEAALTLGYAYLIGLPDDDVERIRVLLDRLSLVGRQWWEEALVRPGLATPLEREALERLRELER